ncbi:hypothetical protein EDD21DRAFT_414420 [Dissophora ornata]|nr:hypothetical protein EDD21DRAFT_414420 [Dissophora ornata]
MLKNDDQGLFQGVISRDASPEAAVLTEWKRREIKRYSLSPEKLRDLRRCGWNFPDQQDIHSSVDESEVDEFRERLHDTMSRFSSLYRHNNNKLPECRQESWFAIKVWDILMELLVTESEWLDHKPGEISSSASSLRRNKGRDLETRRALGRKADGIITCKNFDFDFEIGAIEIGRIDDGPTGTKVLKDGRKISKLLKDMFDLICSKCKSPSIFRSELRVYGLLISGLRVEFLSLRHLEGRYYHLVREDTLTIPSSWNESGICSILIMVTKMLVFRDRMESMARLANNRISTDEEDLDRALSGVGGSVLPPLAQSSTLSAPKNAPKRRRKKITVVAAMANSTSSKSTPNPSEELCAASAQLPKTTFCQIKPATPPSTQQNVESTTPPTKESLKKLQSQESQYSSSRCDDGRRRRRP